MSADIVNLCEERLKRRGAKPILKLFGLSSRADGVLKVSLAAVSESKRKELLTILAAGSYVDMLCSLSRLFYLKEI